MTKAKYEQILNQCEKIVSQNTPLDTILKIVDCKDCFDIVGKANGYVKYYRIYKKDNSIYEI